MTISHSMGIFENIDVQMNVELGRTSMSLQKLMTLNADSIVTLDRLIDEPVDLMVNGKRVARGEVVRQGNHFGVRILEVDGQADGLLGGKSTMGAVPPTGVGAD
ncbi:flagellar motor switch protein FliN [Sphingomicrobium astaxanthinifaciens]|uniref:flagellar motor switch protein FliN n=1 Tax=Sphingomicrobium astaxanthinifaciens TaxID=1227949 RepID=UPI001FCC3483|nr:flagellar motor switch protein FliN [Sphingomicrobium astaxanthinifaciens]MCJ7420359.1 flagellar motor switch protein FliN [Sphingomicrobium astaxanthinifaciens]